MLFSTKQFEDISFKMLLNIQNGRYAPKDFDFQISDEDYYNILSEMIDYGYVEGFTEVNILRSSSFKAINPRVTHGGLSFIEMVIANRILLPLVRKASSHGLSKATLTKTEIEQYLDIPAESIILQLEALEHNGILSIESKLHADDVLSFFIIKLTTGGFNRYSSSPIFNEKIKASTININQGIENHYTNSNVFYGNITISDSFKHEINSILELSETQKNELIELVEQLKSEQKNNSPISNQSKSSVFEYFKSLAGKASETAVAQSVTLLIKELFK